MPTLNEIYNTTEVNAYVRNRNELQAPEVAKIDQLFPAMKNQETIVTNLVGGSGLPVTASVHAWDSTTEVGSRDGFKISQIEKALIKRQIPIREQDIMMLNSTNNRAIIEQIKKTLYDDAGKMVDSVLTKSRAMAMQALSTGKVTIENENHLQKMEIDYGIPDNHKAVLGTDAYWTVDGADIIGDILKWSMAITDDGGEAPAYLIAGRKIFANIAKSASIKKAILGTAVPRPITQTEINNFLEGQGLPKFITIDAKYRKQKANGKYDVIPFVPENTVILVPNGAVGRREFGPTAEEYELTNDKAYDLISQQNVIVEVYRTPDPVARWTKAVTCCMPTLSRANEIFIAKVGA